MKILIAGCSFATQLSNILKNRIPAAEIVNVASAAAGNKFIAESVILSTIKQNFDIVYISWSGLSRYDVAVADVSYFDNWVAKGKIHDVNYVFTGGIWNWDHLKHPFADLLFVGHHKLVERKELHYNSLLEMIKLKGYLEARGIPFYCTTMINQFQDPLIETVIQRSCEVSARQFPEHSKLIDCLEIDKWLFKDSKGMFEAIYDLNLIDEDGFHPNIEGYGVWMDLFVERLKQDKII